MEISLAKLVPGLSETKGVLDMVSTLLRPSRFRRKPSVSNPNQRKLAIDAFAPEGFFESKVSGIHKDMTKLYGNIPLWVDYSMVPNSVSWNLGSVRAMHNLIVYGDKMFTEEFVSRVVDVVGKVVLGESNGGVNVLNLGELTELAKDVSPSSDSGLLPSVITNSSNKSNKSFIGASSLVAGLASAILAFTLIGKRRTSGSNARVARSEALGTALDSVKKISARAPVLEREQSLRGGWRFVISGYEVNVNKRGFVEKVVKVIG